MRCVADAEQPYGYWGGNVPIILVVNDQGGGVIQCSTEDTSPTLRAEAHQHLPVVVIDEDTDREKVL